MSKTNDITIEQGTDGQIEWTVKDDGGTTIDVTGWTARMQARPTYPGPIKINFTTENGKLSTSTSKVVASYVPIDTDAIAIPGNNSELALVYDVEVINPSGKVYRISDGTLTISRNVTRN